MITYITTLVSILIKFPVFVFNRRKFYNDYFIYKEIIVIFKILKQIDLMLVIP